MESSGHRAVQWSELKSAAPWPGPVPAAQRSAGSPAEIEIYSFILRSDYGRIGVPSDMRAPRLYPGEVYGNFAASFSSMSIPKPGRSFEYMDPPLISGVPGNTSKT